MTTSVAEWGLGRPDFGSVPNRTQIGADQTAVTIGATVAMPPGDISFTAYTVPAGKTFILGYIKTSTAIDCIMKGDFMKNGVSFCPLQATQMVIDQLPDTSGFVFNAGDTLGFQGTNPLAVPNLTTICLSGFLYPE